LAWFAPKSAGYQDSTNHTALMLHCSGLCQPCTECTAVPFTRVSCHINRPDSLRPALTVVTAAHAPLHKHAVCTFQPFNTRVRWNHVLSKAEACFKPFCLPASCRPPPLPIQPLQRQHGALWQPPVRGPHTHHPSWRLLNVRSQQVPPTSHNRP
jgi:hypothetical protein